MPKLTRRTAIIGGLVAVATTAIGLSAGSSYARERTEEPAYEVLSSHDLFEVRLYQPRIVAEVEVEGNGKQASNAGFRVLADFIFGNNQTRDSIAMTAPVDRRPTSSTIAMTAPVDQRQTDEERWVVAFTMPSKYTMETLPRPVNERVKIREIPPTVYAVMRFSGAPPEAKVQQRMELLAEAVGEQGLTVAGSAPSYARYDPPWTLPMLRRNEIFLELSMPDKTEAPPSPKK
ncbi:MAG: heme-binding protein [Nannocystaceae bacterium]